MSRSERLMRLIPLLYKDIKLEYFHELVDNHTRHYAKFIYKNNYVVSAFCAVSNESRDHVFDILFTYFSKRDHVMGEIVYNVVSTPLPWLYYENLDELEVQLALAGVDVYKK